MSQSTISQAITAITPVLAQVPRAWALLRQAPHHRPERPSGVRSGRPSALDLRPGRRLPPRQRRAAWPGRFGRDRSPELDRRQGLSRSRHDHSYQEDRRTETSLTGKGVQHCHQQNRLPPTTRDLRRHHQRRYRATVLSSRVNKPHRLLSPPRVGQIDGHDRRPGDDHQDDPARRAHSGAQHGPRDRKS